jgi:hypothetical protein
MNFLKLFLGAIVLTFLLFSSGSQFVACTKTKTIYDTVVVKDTLTIRDTITISPCACNLKEGLVAYYNFTDGNLNDSSGKNNNIVFNNATKTADRFGKPNGAYLFNGTSNYMKVTNAQSLNPDTAITLMAIVKINGFNTGSCHVNQILGKSYDDYINGIYALRFSDYKANCWDPLDITTEQFSGVYGNNQSGSAAYAKTDSVFAKTGQWYNIIYTYQGGTAKIYINGVLKDSRQKTSTFIANNYDLYIGGTPNPQYPYPLNGVIDEIRIYNRALCAEAIQELNKAKE